MKKLMVFALLVFGPTAFAGLEGDGILEQDTCLAQATGVIDSLLQIQNWKEPNAARTGLFGSEVTQSTNAEGDVTYSGSGSLWIRHDYDYSPRYITTATLQTDSECTLLEEPVVKKVLVNVDGPKNEPDGTISCQDKSVSLKCEAGMLDRCKYAEAETHLCVPDFE